MLYSVVTPPPGYVQQISKTCKKKNHVLLLHYLVHILMKFMYVNHITFVQNCSSSTYKISKEALFCSSNYNNSWKTGKKHVYLSV